MVLRTPRGRAFSAHAARREGSSSSASFAMRRRPSTRARLGFACFETRVLPVARGARLAQLAEHGALHSAVAGSIPASHTQDGREATGFDSPRVQAPARYVSQGTTHHHHAPPPEPRDASQRTGTGARPGRPVVGRIPAPQSATPRRRARSEPAFFVERGEPRATRRVPSAPRGASSPTPQPYAGVGVATGLFWLAFAIVRPRIAGIVLVPGSGFEKGKERLKC